MGENIKESRIRRVKEAMRVILNTVVRMGLLGDATGADLKEARESVQEEQVGSVPGGFRGQREGREARPERWAVGWA